MPRTSTHLSLGPPSMQIIAYVLLTPNGETLTRVCLAALLVSFACGITAVSLLWHSTYADYNYASGGILSCRVLTLLAVHFLRPELDSCTKQEECISRGPNVHKAFSCCMSSQTCPCLLNIDQLHPILCATAVPSFTGTNAMSVEWRSAELGCLPSSCQSVHLLQSGDDGRQPACWVRHSLAEQCPAARGHLWARRGRHHWRLADR